MNWYKFAQFSLQIERIIYSPDAQRDLQNFQRTFPNKPVKTIVQEVKERIEKLEIINQGKYTGAAPMFILAPRGLATQGYRIGAQLCKWEDKEGNSHNYLLIRRIFEDHHVYEQWLTTRAEWRDECGDNPAHEQNKDKEKVTVPFDSKNPRPWLVHTVSAIERRDAEVMKAQKHMLSMQGEDSLMQLMESMDKEKAKIRFDIFDMLQKWIQEYWDIRK